ncbi:MAG TPA: DUF3846 domain-containing protein [Arthrobacter sp.]|nr:DUF3846 domain-containing protein [Arthrobacter sp.]
MSTTCTALIVPARLSQRVRVEAIDPTLATLQDLVEGNVEAITSSDWHVYLNDEGDAINLPANGRAEVLIREAGVFLEDSFSGTAVFLGHGRHVNRADAPGHLIRLAERLFDTELAAELT